MHKVVQKIERYFGCLEFGVYKEAEGPGEKGAVWPVKKNEKAISYLRAMNAQGRHIFVRPAFEREANYMMCDDLDKKGLEKHHQQDGKFKPGRLVVESSPDNYQVWIRSDRSLSIEEKKHWLEKMDSDPGASPRHRWGRAPGFRNRKNKYEVMDGDKKRYPLARLVWVDWKGRAKVPKVELPNPEIEQQPREAAPKAFGGRPGVLPVRSDFEKGNNSSTDFAYALALMRRGVDRSEVEERIRSERSDWQHHKGELSMKSYFKLTLDKAQEIIDRSPATPRQSERRDRAEEEIQTQTYRIAVKNVGTKVKRSTMVEILKENEAKATLDDRARTMAVQIGFEKASDIQVDVEPVKNRSNHKKKVLELGLQGLT